MNESALSILAAIRTTDEVAQVQKALETLESGLYTTHTATVVQDALASLPSPIVNALMEKFGTQPPTDGNRDQYIALIQNFMKELQACKVVTLTLVHLPTEASMQQYAAWAKKELGANVVIAIEVNPTILGSAIVVANGRYKDYSVRKKLQQIFTEQRAEIKQLLENKQ